MPQTAQIGDAKSVAETTAAIKNLIASDLDVNIELDEINDDVSLLESGLALDSVVIVELISLLEQRFDFHFSDENMKPALFENLTTLAQFVAERTGVAEAHGVAQKTA
ncbi:MAG: acyl carrier protein [Acidobacteriota bacterium]